MLKSLSIIFLSVFLAALSLFYSYHHLKFDTDQDNLISNSQTYQKIYKGFLQEFGDQESIIVIIENDEKNIPLITNVLDSLYTVLSPRGDLYENIQYKMDMEFFEKRFLFTLSDAEFEKTKKSFESHLPIIQESLKLSTLDAFLEKATSFISTPTQPTGNTNGMEEAITLFGNILKNLNSPSYFKNLDLGSNLTKLMDLPSVSILREKGYLTSDDGKLVFMQILPKKDYSTSGVIEEPLKFLKEKIAIIKKVHPELNIGITGRPVLQHDEMESTGTDSIGSGIAAFIGVFILFGIFYRAAKGPLLAALSLVMGIAWSLGFITLTIGHLNLLSMVFAIILIGLGLEYGIHILFRYQEVKKSIPNTGRALNHTLKTIGPTLVVSALCSMSAFLSALFTDFLGLKELGFVAGAGLFFCLVSQVITLPALIYLTDFSKTKKVTSPLHIPMFPFIKKYPKLTLGIFTAISLLVSPLLVKVSFEHNLLNLQDESLESVKWEKKLIDSSGLSTWFLASLTTSTDKLKERSIAATQLESVKSIDSILSFVGHDDTTKKDSLRPLYEQLHSIETLPVTPITPQKTAEILTNLKNALQSMQNKAFGAGLSSAIEEIEKNITSLDKQLDELAKNPEGFTQTFNESNENFHRNIKSLSDTFITGLNPEPAVETLLPEVLLKHYKGPSGLYALYIHPSQNIWDPENLKNFVGDIRKIDPMVTGAPITVYESAKLMERGFALIAILTVLIVAVILWFDLKKLSDCLLAALPLIFGILWLFILMGFFNIRLSLANFFALPLLIGSSIDTGIHMVHHFKETRSAEKTFYDLATPIILSLGTMFIGFGPLAFVGHRGLASFGQIMAIGSLTCLLTSLILLPSLFRLRERK